MKLQFISNGQTTQEHLESIERVCLAGVKYVQLRLKNISQKQYIETAQLAKKICDKQGANLIINDKVEVALAVGAAGVHLGKKDRPPMEARAILGGNVWIGGTANTWEDIQYLAQQKVDYIGLGPYRFTTTKKDLSPFLGLKGYQLLLAQMQSEQLDIPILAIGGIRLEDIAEIMATGVTGIAVSGLLAGAINTRQTYEAIYDKLL